MSDPRAIQIQNYQYHLPEEKIAAFPLPERDQSKLLVYQGGDIHESVYAKLHEEIPAGALLVFNDTKVVEARLHFQKETGSVIELFCLEPAGHVDVVAGMCSKGRVRWICLVGGAAKWKQPFLEKTVDTEEGELIIRASIVEKRGDVFEIEFSWQPDHLSFGEVLHRAGIIPLPPYLQRKEQRSDYERYQTVYAREEGSVAAPTAGLHFTPELLQQIQDKGIQTAFTTLHVGAGTFLPVKSDTIGGHVMHREWIRVTDLFLERLVNLGEAQLIPVGTTSLRTLESVYWMGVKALKDPDADTARLEIQQWDPYDLADTAVQPKEALQALLQWMQKKEMKELICQTQLLIAPGYTYRMADALITNFHQPGSTLLLLVAALIGEDWRKVYEYALKHDFRFLSYGDGSLLWKR